MGNEAQARMSRRVPTPGGFAAGGGGTTDRWMSCSIACCGSVADFFSRATVAAAWTAVWASWVEVWARAISIESAVYCHPSIAFNRDARPPHYKKSAPGEPGAAPVCWGTSSSS